MNSAKWVTGVMIRQRKNLQDFSYFLRKEIQTVHHPYVSNHRYIFSMQGIFKLSKILSTPSRFHVEKNYRQISHLQMLDFENPVRELIEKYRPTWKDLEDVVDMKVMLPVDELSDFRIRVLSQNLSQFEAQTGTCLNFIGKGTRHPNNDPPHVLIIATSVECLEKGVMQINHALKEINEKLNHKKIFFPVNRSAGIIGREFIRKYQKPVERRFDVLICARHPSSRSGDQPYLDVVSLSDNDLKQAVTEISRITQKLAKTLKYEKIILQEDVFLSSVVRTFIGKEGLSHKDLEKELDVLIEVNSCKTDTGGPPYILIASQSQHKVKHASKIIKGKIQDMHTKWKSIFYH